MSLISAKSIDINKHELEVRIDSKTFLEGIEKAYKKNVKSISIPGFRKGKAPRKMVEKMYGEGVFFEDAINIVYPKVVKEAIDESKLELVDSPDLDIVSADLTEGVLLKLVCTTKPEIEISNYKGLEVDKLTLNITDQDVEDELLKMRERNARLITVEDRAVIDNDEVNIDFEGFIDGVPFEGGKGQSHTLTIGSGQFIPGFEEQILGHGVLDEFDVNVAFPDDYHSKELASKSALFKVKLNEVKSKELPDLDDEFAKDVSEFDSLSELKESIKEKLLEANEKSMEQQVEKSLIDLIISNISGDIPEVMYEHKIDDTIRDFEQRLSSQGMTIELYMQYTGLTNDAFRASFREQAESQVKLRLALEKIASMENIQVSDEEIEEQYNKFVDMYKMPVEDIKKHISEKGVKEDLAVSKAVEFVKSNAKITEKEELEIEDTEGDKNEDAKVEKSSKKVDKVESKVKKAPAKKTGSTTVAKTTTSKEDKEKSTKAKKPAKAKKEDKEDK